MYKKMNSTIQYYNEHAEEYFKETIDINIEDFRKKFISLLPKNAKIIDIGCGSGRDVKAFSEMGYNAIGLDIAENLSATAKQHLNIDIIYENMINWKSSEPFDGMWCCGSLLHLHDDELQSFLQNLKYNLKQDGIIFVSVKEGIPTGINKDGRYFHNYTQNEICDILNKAGLEIIDIEITKDLLKRYNFQWLCIFARRI